MGSEGRGKALRLVSLGRGRRRPEVEDRMLSEEVGESNGKGRADGRGSEDEAEGGYGSWDWGGPLVEGESEEWGMGKL
jgi:hypothetical protein